VTPEERSDLFRGALFHEPDFEQFTVTKRVPTTSGHIRTFDAVMICVASFLVGCAIGMMILL
jgi:hypothetical protein